MTWAEMRLFKKFENGKMSTYSFLFKFSCEIFYLGMKKNDYRRAIEKMGTSVDWDRAMFMKIFVPQKNTIRWIKIESSSDAEMDSNLRIINLVRADCGPTSSMKNPYI
jgi:hypothetical protein